MIIKILTALLPVIKPALIYADDTTNKNLPATRNKLLLVYTLLVAFADVFIAWTLWALAYGLPKKGEITISHTLERLCSPMNKESPDFPSLVEFALKINAASPNHIKVLGLQKL